MTPIEQAEELIAEFRYDEAAALLAPLIGTGNRDADYLFGSLLFCGPDIVDPDDAMEALQRAADLDHPAACFQVATTTVDEDGGIISGPVADEDLLLHAAELGDVEAQRMVALLHVHGEEGFLEDLEVTRYWYERAAAQGHAESQYDLGGMMLEGKGGPVDPEGGLRWLETCAMLSDGDKASETAADFLAIIYEEGRFDVEPDPTASERWRGRQEELAAEAEKRQRELEAERAEDEPA